MTTTPAQHVLWGVKKAHGQTPLKLQIGDRITATDQERWKREGWTVEVYCQGIEPIGLKVQTEHLFKS